MLTPSKYASQFRDIGRALASFVGDHRDVDLAPHPLISSNCVGGQRLLDQLHPLLLQPVDLADRLFFVLPAFVGVDAKRLLRHASDGFDGRLVGGQPDLHFENRVRARLRASSAW